MLIAKKHAALRRFWQAMGPATCARAGALLPLPSRDREMRCVMRKCLAKERLTRQWDGSEVPAVQMVPLHGRHFGSGNAVQ